MKTKKLLDCESLVAQLEKIQLTRILNYDHQVLYDNQEKLLKAVKIVAKLIFNTTEQ